MDTLFHNRLSQLETSFGDVKTEVQLAVADVLEGGLWQLVLCCTCVKLRVCATAEVKR
jgi:hypothetical protein